MVPAPYTSSYNKRQYDELILQLIFVQYSNMPYQARLLVDRMKKEPGVDFENDWKVVTMFIGGNDLCSFCEDRVMYLYFI